MRPQELRIGNIVEHEDPDEVVEGIHYVNEGEYKILIGNYLRPSSEIKPVPLTEEWLLKFGFENRDGIFYIDKKFQLYVRFDSTNELTVWLNDGEEADFDIYITTLKPEVHVFQNFVFAFCDTELTIKQ